MLFQVEKTCNSNPSELLLYPAKEPNAPSSPSTPAPPAPAVISAPQGAADKPSPAQEKTPGGVRPTRPGSRSPQSPPSSSSSPSPPQSPAALGSDLKVKLEELLEKYSNGLWAHALPKLFQDTYKVSVPSNASRGALASVRV